MAFYKSLIVTRVVFKLGIDINSKEQIIGLIVTRVVFKFLNYFTIFQI